MVFRTFLDYRAGKEDAARRGAATAQPPVKRLPPRRGPVRRPPLRPDLARRATHYVESRTLQSAGREGTPGRARGHAGTRARQGGHVREGTPVEHRTGRIVLHCTGSKVLHRTGTIYRTVLVPKRPSEARPFGESLPENGMHR